MSEDQMAHEEFDLSYTDFTSEKLQLNLTVATLISTSPFLTNAIFTMQVIARTGPLSGPDDALS